MLKKDYLGEASIPLDDWFRDGNAFAFDDANNRVSCCFSDFFGSDVIEDPCTAILC